MFSKSYAYLVCGMLVCATIIPSVSFADDLQSIEKLADQGEAKAQYEWGMRLVNGDKIKQDTIRGRRWIEKAARQGYRDAQTPLGLMYIIAQGVPTTDYQSARVWLEKASAQGDKQASYWPSELYQSGKGTKRDDDKAFEYIKKAAEQRHAEAQMQLGRTYYLGFNPISVDYHQAKYWFKKAAAPGEVNAQFYLAQIYQLGNGVVVDINKAKSIDQKLC